MKLKIDGDFYDYFSGLAINLKLDSVASVFSFNVKFNPDNEVHRNLFRPLEYKKVELFNSDNVLIFTGVILYHKFKSTSNPELLNLSGYSLPGILEDVQIPVSSYPLESLNRSLKDIFTKLLNEFNIGLVIDSSAEISANAIYKKSVASPTESIKTYLAKLTSQRDLVLSHNEKGELIVYKPTESKPVYYFNQDNCITMNLDVNGQVLHSEINVIRQPSEENTGVSTADSVANNLVTIFRPKTKILSSGEDTDVINAADNERSNELKAISLSIVLNRIEEVILPGVTVEVLNPELFLFKRTKFTVIDVSLSGDSNSEKSTIKLVLPQTFTSDNPVKIFNI